MEKKVIGVIGGFGGYATLGFYSRFLEVFKGDTEREYPQIIIDNNFQMPSRTRALLTGEKYDDIVKEISKSIHSMIYGEVKVDVIVLVCGTAHFFLKDVYKIIPEAKDYVMDIIDTTGLYLKDNGMRDVFVIAAEGTLRVKLFQEKLKFYGITCKVPEEKDYCRIRYFIECVKTNSFSKELNNEFLDFLNKYNVKTVLLGCTEFPVLVNRLIKENNTNGFNFVDPIECTLKKLKNYV